FAVLLRKLSDIQDFLPVDKELSPLRIAIVTARNAPSHMRVIKTLRKWNVYVDEAYFMGGLPKEKVLEAFGAHIFFDDQHTHLSDSSKKVPCGRVLYKSNSVLKKYERELILKPKTKGKKGTK
ncbi:5'-nucleotidase, partial [Pricia sp.]|uniref:5'-nucleotidase n=1 Tax=Pricia sp. TaxID=2268138 RepID=UPI0035948F27